MSKVMLVDGNSMLFRAFYATSYTGSIMQTSNGTYTNAVYAFSNMIFKAINEVKPDYLLVAFDKGKHTFRHELIDDYKGGRKETPVELVPQFKLVRDMCSALNISYLELDDIEADDIVGSAATKFKKDNEVFIYTSDKDILQVVDDKVTVCMMSKGVSDVFCYTPSTFEEKFGFKPLQMIDYKAIAGDNSDNLKGVAGIGEKGATDLIRSYTTLENIYEHLDELKPGIQKKLIADKESAFTTKKVVTIKTDVEQIEDLESYKFSLDQENGKNFYLKYEMNSLVSKLSRFETSTIQTKPVVSKDLKFVKSISNDLLKDNALIYFEMDNNSYYDNKIYAVSVSLNDQSEFITYYDFLKDEDLKHFISSSKKKYVYNLKQLKHLLDIEVNNADDLMLMAFIANNYLSDLNKLFNYYELDPVEETKDFYGSGAKTKEIESDQLLLRLNTISSNLNVIKDKLIKKLKDDELEEYYTNIELPLCDVLYNMEKEGVNCSIDVLSEITANLSLRVSKLEKEIYELAEEEFNINSPKQLATILFDKLGLPDKKKRSTAAEVLEKLENYHPIISLIGEYRKLTKIISTYSEGLKKYIDELGKIHTIYTQTITQTGRLSSIEPNLQNLSIKDPEGAEIRKAFVASADHTLISADYSNVELRVLSALANEQAMIESFIQGKDIHSETAMKIFNLEADEVTSNIRRKAKAINFGIIYGISDFGLSKQAEISIMEAKQYIENYFNLYPSIKKYLDNQIDFLKQNGYVKTLLNRRRYINEINDPNFLQREFAKRASMNTPVQGSAADIMKLAMIKISNVINERNLKSKMIMQIHDELVFDVSNDEIDIMKEIIKKGMCEAYKLPVPLDIEMGQDHTLYGCK